MPKVMQKVKTAVKKAAKKVTGKKVTKKVAKKAAKKATKKASKSPGKRRPLAKNEVPTANDGDEGGPGAPAPVEEVLTRDDFLHPEIETGPEVYGGDMEGFDPDYHEVEVEDEDEQF